MAPAEFFRHRRSGGGCSRLGVAPFLVRTYSAVVFERIAHAGRLVLGRYCGFAFGRANVWPRAMLVVCFVCFLSFVSAAGDFSEDLVRWHAVGGRLYFTILCAWRIFPRLGDRLPPRASLFLLLWGWVPYLYSESVLKPPAEMKQWCHLTAMDEYDGVVLRPLVLDGTCSICRTGFTRRPLWLATLVVTPGTGIGVDAVPAKALADRTFLPRHPLAVRRHSDGELRVLELHRLGAGASSVWITASYAFRAGVLAKQVLVLQKRQCRKMRAVHRRKARHEQVYRTKGMADSHGLCSTFMRFWLAVIAVSLVKLDIRCHNLADAPNVSARSPFAYRSGWSRLWCHFALPINTACSP